MSVSRAFQSNHIILYWRNQAAGSYIRLSVARTKMVHVEWLLMSPYNSRPCVSMARWIPETPAGVPSANKAAACWQLMKNQTCFSQQEFWDCRSSPAPGQGMLNILQGIRFSCTYMLRRIFYHLTHIFSSPFYAPRLPLTAMLSLWNSLRSAFQISVSANKKCSKKNWTGSKSSAKSASKAKCDNSDLASNPKMFVGGKKLFQRTLTTRHNQQHLWHSINNNENLEMPLQLIGNSGSLRDYIVQNADKNERKTYLRFMIQIMHLHHSIVQQLILCKVMGAYPS